MADARDREAIAADYREPRGRADAAAMRRFQNEEACFVLLAILERLAADDRSFVHQIALKGGILGQGRTSDVVGGSGMMGGMREARPGLTTVAAVIAALLVLLVALSPTLLFGQSLSAFGLVLMGAAC